MTTTKETSFKIQWKKSSLSVKHDIELHVRRAE